jgi:hypothetical protein
VAAIHIVMSATSISSVANRTFSVAPSSLADTNRQPNAYTPASTSTTPFGRPERPVDPRRPERHGDHAAKTVIRSSAIERWSAPRTSASSPRSAPARILTSSSEPHDARLGGYRPGRPER